VGEVVSKKSCPGGMVSSAPTDLLSVMLTRTVRIRAARKTTYFTPTPLPPWL
jgi:hypothetical protein